MTKQIPPGYQIVFNSYESDGDGRSTETISGLSESEARFLIDFAKLFSSMYAYRGVSFGNGAPRQDFAYSDVYDAVCKVVAAHTSHWDDETFSKCTDPDAGFDFKEEVGRELVEFARDHIIGYTMNECVNNIRAFDGFTVYYISEPQKDVTSHFE